MTKRWQQFEQAVAAILRELEPESTITQNKFTNDADTGLPRQRDVWIETKFGNHLTITILISCKRKNRNLSQQDIDAFIGELRSSGANKGVIYAYAGFSKPALLKASKLGISCCSLLENDRFDLPGIIKFKHYLCKEQIRLYVSNHSGALPPDWPQLLRLPAINDSGGRSAAAVIADNFNACQAVPGQEADALPPAPRRGEQRSKSKVVL
jgi:hypothetical protein